MLGKTPGPKCASMPYSPYTGDNKRRIFRKPCRCSYWWECHTNGADRIGGSDQKIKDYSKYWQRGGTFKSDLIYFWHMYYHKSGRRPDPWSIDLGPTVRPQSKKSRQSPKVQWLGSPAALTWGTTKGVIPATKHQPLQRGVCAKLSILLSEITLPFQV